MRFASLLIGVLAGLPLIAGEASTVVPDTRRVLTVRADQGTGRLVRSVVIQPKLIQPVKVKAVDERELTSASKLSTDAAVNDLVEDAARRHKVDPLLVHSVIQVESGYNKYAVSPKGAQGLMQLIPETARRLGVRNPFDPKENIEAGVRYLKQLQTQFGDDRLALAAYNAGENAVARYKWIPPYEETQNYVYRVGLRYGAARRAAETTKPAATVVEQPRRVEEFEDAEGRVHLRLR